MSRNETEQQANRGKVKAQQFGAFIAQRRAAFEAAVPSGVSPEKLLKVALNAYSRTPELWECSTDSVYSCIQQAGSLGLEVNGPLGHAYLVARWNKVINGKEATLMIGYKGYLELARRGGEVDHVDVRVVYEGDVFEVLEDENGTHLTHKPSITRRADAAIRAAYSRVRLKSGTTSLNMMIAADIERRKDKGNAKSDMWTIWPEEGAKKTVFRNHFKWLPIRADDLERLAAVEGDDDAPLADFSSVVPDGSTGGAGGNDPGTSGGSAPASAGADTPTTPALPAGQSAVEHAKAAMKRGSANGQQVIAGAE